VRGRDRLQSVCVPDGQNQDNKMPVVQPGSADCQEAAPETESGERYLFHCLPGHQGGEREEKDMKGLSNTQRTLRGLRQEGYIAGIVERWNPYAGKYGVRQDLFGVIDIIAIKHNAICGIQSCGSDFAEHNRKILANEFVPEWLKAGGHLELWGWRKVKLKKGGKAMRWRPRVKVYRLEDFDGNN